MKWKEDQMNERFGPAIIDLLETSPVRQIWNLSFLVNFFLGPLYMHIAKQFDVSRAEVQILYSLTQRDVLVAQDIALVTGQPKNTISRAISLLLDKGYLYRTTSEDDKRAKSLELSDSGRTLIQEIIPVIQVRQELMREVLTEDEKKTFDALLSKIVYSLPEWVDPDENS